MGKPMGFSSFRQWGDGGDTTISRAAPGLPGRCCSTPQRPDAQQALGSPGSWCEAQIPVELSRALGAVS